MGQDIPINDVVVSLFPEQRAVNPDAIDVRPSDGKLKWC